MPPADRSEPPKRKASLKETFIGCGVLFVIVALLFLLVSTCEGPSEEEQPDGENITTFGVATRVKVEALLKDPDSAQFRNVVAYRHPNAAGYVFCGEVNAKNAFGGYSGHERFVGNPITAALESMDPKEFQKGWDQFCNPSRRVEDARWF